MPTNKADMLRDYLEGLGVSLSPHRPGWQRIRCPFHDDRHPSASLNLTKGWFECFACGVRGDYWNVTGKKYRSIPQSDEPVWI